MAYKYSVQIKYNVAAVFDVEAKDEGEALTKARELAEMAPMSSFSIVEEDNSRIVNVVPLDDRNHG